MKKVLLDWLVLSTLFLVFWFAMDANTCARLAITALVSCSCSDGCCCGAVDCPCRDDPAGLTCCGACDCRKAPARHDRAPGK